MRWNKILPILIIVPLITLFITSVLLFSPKLKKDKLKIKDIPNSDVQVKEDYERALNRIFQEYSNGNVENITSTAVEGLGDGKSGFQAIPKEYFLGKYEVKNIRSGLAGGKEMLITFNAAPDKTFWVWIYQLAGGSYQIRGIQLDHDLTK